MLFSFHLFGRATKSVSTRLENSDASHVHAEIRWDGSVWSIVDHSKNGTWLDNKRLNKNHIVPLSRDCLVQFGYSGLSQWWVEDISPPGPVLLPYDRNKPSLALKGVHLLPNDEVPQACIYCDENDRWVIEQKACIRMLEQGDTVSLDQESWRFFMPQVCENTKESTCHISSGVRNVFFHFDVSQNEEHVIIEFQTHKNRYSLSERSHHYLLLLLVRQRRQHMSSGLNETEVGWISIDKLCSMLKFNEPHLNIQIYRARKQFFSALKGREILPQIIERRLGQVRFTFPHFTVSKGGLKEIHFPPEEVDLLDGA